METLLFALIFLLYLALIAAGSWLVFQSGSREIWRNRWHTNWGRVKAPVVGIVKAVQFLAPHRLITPFRNFYRLVRARKRMAIATCILLLAPGLFALIFLRDGALEGFDDTPKTSDPVILALLRGEQLVPPPTLPPEYFLTKEVEAQRQDLVSASREWMKLDTEFRQRLLTVYTLTAKRGYQVTLLEGYRSPERQASLAKQGSQVTNAGAYQSYHQYGLAGDSAFLRDGKLVISEKDPWAMEGYRQFGELAESVGLVWGGRWRMMDFGHVELRRPNVLGHVPSVH